MMSEKKKWESKKVSLSAAIIVGFCVALLGLTIGFNWNVLFAGSYFGGGDYKLDWSSLDTVYDRLSKNFNGDIDTSILIEGAKKGMVDALGDAYTVYMSPSESDEFYDSLHGNVGSGIGVEIAKRNNYVRVLRTLPDNPAGRAGIMAGDIIYKVDGEEVWNLSAEEISRRVRGETGTEVTVAVVRDGMELDFKMVREELNNVSSYVNYDGKTAIVTITRFDNDTGKEVRKVAEKFAEKGINKVILDLRGNGGGYVTAAQELLGLWIDGEAVYEQRSKHYGDESAKASSGDAILKDMKTVVLVNGSTASASEIVAGALQDYKKATILGEQTYGKGVVQNLIKIPDGSLLKVTTGEWFTPLGNSINDKGITPDKVVERTYEDVNAMRDPQMDAAKKL